MPSLYHFSRIYETNSLLELIHKSISKVSQPFLYILLLPLTIIFHLLNYRVIHIRVNRIGHLAAEFDCFSKEISIGNYSNYKFLFLKNHLPIVNKYLYNLYYINNHFIEINNNFLSYFINIMSTYNLMNFLVDSYVLKPKKNRSIYTIYNQWADKSPIISIPDVDQIKFINYKSFLGMEADSWYVIFHARDAEYSPVDEYLQSHRNHSLSNFEESINYVTSQGGYALIYTNEESSINFEHSKIILNDKVILHKSISFKTEMLDILVCANARYFVGGTSGLFYACKIFNIPIFITNGIPLTVLPPQAIDLFIPKLIFSIKLGRILKINELFKLKIYKLFHSFEYKKNNLVPIENNSKDIAQSFINWLENKEQFELPITLIYKNSLQSSDYGYNSRAKVCALFLNNYYY